MDKVKNSKESKKAILNNEYFKNSKYLCLGMAIIIIGIINFVIAYMFFPSIWAKNLSISTLLILLGICIIIISEGKIRRINREMMK